MQVKAFTATAQGIVPVLISAVQVGPAFNVNAGEPAPIAHIKDFAGVWDTGASASVITQKVVDQCGLQPTGVMQVHTANGTCEAKTYLVCISLPNGVGFHSVKVTLGDVPSTDVLIGMDIIGSGDFAVTNAGGVTMFSFRHPSIGHIDFVKEVQGPPKPRGGFNPRNLPRQKRRF